MRKVTFMFFLAIVTMCMTGCSDSNDDDEGYLIVDWGPVVLWMDLVDKNGNDLLDPSNEAKPYEGATITYRGKTYTVADSSAILPNTQPRVSTRYILPTEFGFLLISKAWTHEGGKGNILVFGEIDGAKDMDEDLVITWPDGKQNTIHYHCSDHNDKALSCNRWYALDGKRQESNRFVITK